MGWGKNPPSNFIHTVNDDAVSLVVNIVKDAYPYLVLGTPVMDGTARGNYRVSINLPDFGFSNAMQDVSGTSAINKGVAYVANNFKLGDVIYLQNNLPYIRRLENGWSQQAPKGMFKLTMQYIRGKYG